MYSKDLLSKLQENNNSCTELISNNIKTDSLNIIRSILGEKIAISKIEHCDCEGLQTVFIKDRKHWVCRFYYGHNRKALCLPQDNYTTDIKLEIKYIEDLFNYSEHLEKALGMALSTLSSEI